MDAPGIGIGARSDGQGAPTDEQRENCIDPLLRPKESLICPKTGQTIARRIFWTRIPRTIMTLTMMRRRKENNKFCSQIILVVRRKTSLHHFGCRFWCRPDAAFFPFVGHLAVLRDPRATIEHIQDVARDFLTTFWHASNRRCIFFRFHNQ